MNRYHRQTLLPEIADAGQSALVAARVLLVGCGALGCTIAEQLGRAGVGFLRIVDRDVVEWTNLQRQTLYDESHARGEWPKAAAAAERLAAINSNIIIDAQVTDVNAANVEALAGLVGESGNPPVDLILDGTDNVATRYLINDVAVKHGVPWIYGACVGVEGRVMAVRPGRTPCVRCIFPSPPRAEDLATCDTRGVLGPAAAIVASLQVAATMKLLTDARWGAELITLNVWSSHYHCVDLSDSRDPRCPCCGDRHFEFLSSPVHDHSVKLCGRDAVQVQGAARIALPAMAERWRPLGAVEESRYFVRCQLTEPTDLRLTLFADGRLIVQGTTDTTRAKSIYARFVGT